MTFSELYSIYYTTVAKIMDMPKKIYIISDIEFTFCVEDCGITNFEYTKELFERNGYTLPDVVF